MITTIMLAAALFRGPDPQFFPPRPATVTISRDTVWFHANEWHDQSPVSACYIVSTRRWCEISRTAFSIAAPTALPPRLAGFLEAARRPSDDDASTCLVHGGQLWVAFPGFDTEGLAQRGTLAVIDTVTGRVVRYSNASIVSHRVTQMAAEGSILWLATQRDGEYGAYGESGVVRVDLGGRTPRFLPSQERSQEHMANVVERIAAKDGVVAIMARAGVAVRLPDGQWDWRYWQLGVQGEAIVHTLVETAEYNPDAMLLLAVANMRLARAGSVFRALKQQNATFPDPSWLPIDETARILLDAGALPMVKQTIAQHDSVHPVVLAAAGLSGDRTLLPLLRPNLATRGSEVAVALVRLGDTTGVAQFRRMIADARSSYVGIDGQLSSDLARAASPEMVRMIQAWFARGVNAQGATLYGSSREPEGLSYEVAAQLLEVLDAMDTLESRAAAQLLRQPARNR